MAVEIVSLVWQLVEATSSAYKAYKICHVVGLKKSQCHSLRFLRKAPTKNYQEKEHVQKNRVQEKTRSFQIERSLWLFKLNFFKTTIHTSSQN